MVERLHVQVHVQVAFQVPMLQCTLLYQALHGLHSQHGQAMLSCTCSAALSAEPPSSKLSPVKMCLRARRPDTTADSGDTCLAGRHPKIGRLRFAGKGGVVGVPRGALID